MLKDVEEVKAGENFKKGDMRRCIRFKEEKEDKNKKLSSDLSFRSIHSVS